MPPEVTPPVPSAATPPEGPPPSWIQEDVAANAWLARLLGRALGAYLRLCAATARVSGPPISQAQCVFAIWHESNLVAATAAWRLRDDRRIVSFSTRGFRGIVMNAMLRSMGSGVVTLRDDRRIVSFSTRGFRGIVMNAMLRSMGSGVVSLPDEGRTTRAEAGRLSLELARIGKAGHTVVVSCDGPFGPYRVAKPGVLLVARESGVPIQPWAIAIRPTIRLRRRWDRHLLPLPFARMRVEEGEPIRVGAREPLRPLLARLQAELDDVARSADRRMGGRRSPR
jgi:lysophospholipid acyltransferase (LPLAT)-like uncharacterized protein